MYRHRGPSYLAAFLLALSSCVCFTLVARADDVGDIQLIVAAADSGAPVAGARVFLLGWSSESSLVRSTDAQGALRISNLPTGSYLMSIKSVDFAEARLRVDVRGGTLTDITIHLVPSPKLLARIKVSDKTESASIFYLNDASPVRRLSKDLISAINLLAGAEVSLGPDGQATDVSIRGHDPSSTSYTVGGLRVGGSAAFQTFDPDFVSNARVDLIHEEVGLQLLGPIFGPTYTLDYLGGGFGSSRTATTVQGTTGSTGFVVGHLIRDVTSPLNGAYYLDSSGLAYAHQGTFHGTSTLATFVIPVGSDWRTSANFTETRMSEEPITNIFAGPVPDGIGPGKLDYPGWKC